MLVVPKAWAATLTGLAARGFIVPAFMFDNTPERRSTMNRYIRSQYSSRPASGAEVMRRLGLDPKAHLPKEGIPRGRHTLDGFEVWVTPAPEKGKHKSSKHRVLAMCPECRRILSAGRLQQHMPTHKEVV